MSRPANKSIKHNLKPHLLKSSALLTFRGLWGTFKGLCWFAIGVGWITVLLIILPYRILRYIARFRWGVRFIAGWTVVIAFYLLSYGFEIYFDERVTRLHAQAEATLLTQQLIATVQAKDAQIDQLKTNYALVMENPITAQQAYFLEKKLLPRTRTCGIPDALVAAQWAIETGRNIKRSDNNYFGIGPGIKFPTLEAGVTKYCQVVRNILAHKGYDLDKIKDAKGILEALQAGTYRYEGHNADPYTYVEHVSAAEEFKRYSKI